MIKVKLSNIEELNKNLFVGAISAKEIYDLMELEVLNKSNYTYRENSVNEIKSLLLEDKLFTTNLTFNVESTDDLRINGDSIVISTPNSLNVLDGWQRLIATYYAYQEDKSIDFKFILQIIIGDREKITV